MNFKRILVAINHSPSTSAVFDRALHLAQQEQAHLMILTCVTDIAELNQGLGSDGMMYGYGLSPMSASFPQPSYVETIQAEDDEAESWLEQYCQKATALNVPVEHQHHFTDPGSTICRIAQEWNADLIVLGWHNRGAIAEFFTSSVGNHVMHHANCSVLAIKLAPEDNGSNLADQSKLELNTPQVPLPIRNSRHDSDSDGKKQYA